MLRVNGSAPVNGGGGESPQSTILSAEGDYARLLQTLSRLQSIDTKHELDLPQLVVCGEQSVGKSSVLEAISSIPFPRKAGKCTRFVTQINLRPSRSDGQRIKVTVRRQSEGSHPPRPRFSERINNLNDVERLIEKASDFMGINDNPDNQFSSDILTIDVEKPGQAPLSLVDLPGIIHAQGRTTAVDQVALVDKMVKKWIANDNTIILAVIDTSRDLESHSIIDMAIKVDPQGLRTIGIITKLDMVRIGLPSQGKWIQTALNQNDHYRFSKGWHMLRNLSEEDLKDANAAGRRSRDQRELDFFRNPDNGWEELQELLEKQVRGSLPQIQAQIDTKVQKLAQELEDLSIAGATPEEAKHNVQLSCGQLCKIITEGLQGHYRNTDVYALNPLDPKNTSMKLRNNVRRWNDDFATTLRTKGHGAFFAPDHNDVTPDEDKYLTRIFDVIANSRGEELPDQITPETIHRLFEAYSRGWKSIAEQHLINVLKSCHDFFEWTVDHLPSFVPFDSSIKAGVKTFLRKELEQRRHQALRELQKLEEDRKEPPMTLSELYVEGALQSKYLQEWNGMQKTASGAAKLQRGSWLTPERLAEFDDISTIAGLQRKKAKQFMDDMLIYYKIAMERFIDEVAIHVVERHMLRTLDDDAKKLEHNVGGCLDSICASQKWAELTNKREQVKRDKETFEQYSRDLAAA
ncbi:hypothetical protein LTR41_005268 [Exophiala xenobiotica]|nr:hypothetical protein LTR41_005268 [Exophiala xenobiotica]KAK5324950.1 hypothetical protein LTR93_004425 [Exophiala xenobiotica]KAK5409301.1 hypothetical protein LTR06_006874 [Exophiala xenobiotica]